MDRIDNRPSTKTLIGPLGQRRTAPRSAVILALACFALLILISLWPSRVDDAAGISRLLAAWHAEGLPRWVDYSVVERLANVILYVPIGMLLGIVFGGRRWWLALGGAVACSASVEALQSLLVARSSSWVDVSMNSLGALSGLAIIMAIRTRPTHSVEEH